MSKELAIYLLLLEKNQLREHLNPLLFAPLLLTPICRRFFDAPTRLTPMSPRTLLHLLHHHLHLHLHHPHHHHHHHHHRLLHRGPRCCLPTSSSSRSTSSVACTPPPPPNAPPNNWPANKRPPHAPSRCECAPKRSPRPSGSASSGSAQRTRQRPQRYCGQMTRAFMSTNNSGNVSNLHNFKICSIFIHSLQVYKRSI